MIDWARSQSMQYPQYEFLSSHEAWLPGSLRRLAAPVRISASQLSTPAAQCSLLLQHSVIYLCSTVKFAPAAQWSLLLQHHVVYYCSTV